MWRLPPAVPCSPSAAWPAPLAATGHEASVALGVGGMAAIWGGIGFGAMIGGSMHLMHQETTRH